MTFHSADRLGGYAHLRQATLVAQRVRKCGWGRREDTRRCRCDHHSLCIYCHKCAAACRRAGKGGGGGVTGVIIVHILKQGQGHRPQVILYRPTQPATRQSHFPAAFPGGGPRRERPNCAESHPARAPFPTRRPAHHSPQLFRARHGRWRGRRHKRQPRLSAER
jgi:hypothetical protein